MELFRWRCESGFFEKLRTVPDSLISIKTPPNALTRFPGKYWTSSLKKIENFQNRFSSLRDILILKSWIFGKIEDLGESLTTWAGITSQKQSKTQNSENVCVKKKGVLSSRTCGYPLEFALCIRIHQRRSNGRKLSDFWFFDFFTFFHRVLICAHRENVWKSIQ